MNDAYYYFTATLPHLDFDSDPPMADEDLLRNCRRLLTQEDLAVFEHCMSQQEELNCQNDTVNELAQYNQDFRNELVWFRTQRAHKESGDTQKPRAGYTSIIETVQQAGKEPNLLDAEKILDRSRWQQWDNFLMGKIYGLEYIIVYGLKLKVLNRYNEINSLRGRETFEEIKNMELPI